MEEQSVDASVTGPESPSFDDTPSVNEVVNSLAGQISALTVDLHVANIRIEKLKARNAELEKLAEND